MRYYLVSWDNLGIECLRDVTDHHPDNWARATLFTAIKTSEPAPKSQLGHDIAMMRLRARQNTHRHYEIYLFTSEDSIDLNDIDQWTKDDLQGFVDWVRVNHSKQLWNDRVTKKPVIV